MKVELVPTVKVKKPGGKLIPYILVPKSEAHNYEPWTEADEAALQNQAVPSHGVVVQPDGNDLAPVSHPANTSIIPAQPNLLSQATQERAPDTIDSVLALSATKIKSVLEAYDVDGLSMLEEMLSREQASGRPRVTVVQAIASRIDVLLAK